MKRVLITVERGCVQAIAADSGVKVAVLDCDCDGIEPNKITKLHDVDGGEFSAIVITMPLEGKEIVDHYFKQI